MHSEKFSMPKVHWVSVTLAHNTQFAITAGHIRNNNTAISKLKAKMHKISSENLLWLFVAYLSDT